MYVYRKKIYILFFALFDVIGNILFFPLRSAGRNKPSVPDRILLIRADHIGDVINATAILGPVRKAFPGAVIDFLAPSWAKDILENNPDIDNIIQFDPPWFDRRCPGFAGHIKGLFTMRGIIKRGDYDIAVDLRGDFRHILAMFLSGTKCRVGYGITGGGFLLTHNVPYEGVMHETDRNMELLRALGVEGGTPEVSLCFPENDAKTGEALIREHGLHGKYAVLHAVPGHGTKKWDPGKFAAVARYLSNEKRFIPVAAGTAGDTEEVKKIKDPADIRLIDITGKTSLGALYHILKHASLFVGVDSAPAHMAAAAGIPAVILFSGINDPGQWAPGGENVRVISPGKGKDLLDIGPEEVCEAIDEMMDH